MNNFIYNKCISWSKKTFRQELTDIPDLVDQGIQSKIERIFQRLNILDKHVNGFACESLPKTEEERTAVNIRYSDVFHHVYSKEYFSPVLYLVELVIRYFDLGGPESKIDGFLARGLRTLTSLMREHDFANKLESYLSFYDPDLTVLVDPDQDARDHTDVLLKFNNKEYRIWLFQLSKRGLPHDIERVTGRRGDLPDGIHILCPLKTEIAIEYNKLVKKKRTQEKHSTNCLARINQLSPKAIKTREKEEEKLRNYQNKIQQFSTLLQNLKTEVDKELEIVNGWYFYSINHVERVAKIINNETDDTFYNYNKVLDILLSAERFLSETRIFNKGV